MALMSSPSKRWLQPAVLAIALLIVCPGTASAQFIEFLEWLDRLSGPGPFRQEPQWIPSVRIPVGCITRVTTFTRDLGAVQNALATQSDKELKTQTSIDIEPITGCLGLRGLLGAYKRRGGDTDAPSPPWGIKKTPDGGRPIVRKTNLVAFEVNFANTSGANELPYAVAVEDDQKRVNLFILGVGARANLHENVFAAWSWNNYRFYSPGDLFESFNRSAQTIEAGVKLPFLPRDFRPFLIIGVSTGLGEFTAADFGAAGDWRGFDKHTPFFKIGYEFWHHGCWLNRC
jgi:hypothetical protein